MGENAPVLGGGTIPFPHQNAEGATWGIAATLLGGSLRALRNRDRTMTLRRLVELIHAKEPRASMSASKLSRIEVGDRRLHKADDIRPILDALKIEGSQREELMKLARDASVEGLSDVYRDVAPDWMGRLIELESRAKDLFSLETRAVPGLLQTEAYTRAVLPGSLPVRLRGNAERLAALRVARRERYLQAGPPRSVFYIKHTVLEDLVGSPRVMADQIRRLLEYTELPDIGVRVIPPGGDRLRWVSSMTRLVFHPGDGLPEIIYNEEHGRGKYYGPPEDAPATEGEPSEFNELMEVLQDAMVLAPGREESRQVLHRLLRGWEREA
ncbi:helix-turn-helix domain-containing protein [Kitasatospora sp. NA04385]|uniref:DUF5753 domain-containing protein n=1 Tax=Kitasatospora sp. NA04385 TaxID=2742135 RepID=UPI001591DA7E|nr:DUF5753 domain-containing protein [Kitasatospora sp. NA04385]QKW19599.1 helix-turn-helix domain-containing protein [Kitasatospora sp. NA04385]